jgi:hypothetical protein
MQRNVPIVLSVLVASASAAAQDAVQWSTSSGGNGHWFAVISVPAPHTWQRARQLAAGRGADLASIASHTENEFVKALVRRPEVWNASVGPWIGGYQPAGSQEPNQGWAWSDGTPWTFSDWVAGGPNNGCGDLNENAVHFSGWWNLAMAWNDLPASTCNAAVVGAVIEWSADCNSDGIVDYGQIVAGQLPDTNGNGVPDGCEETGCVADVVRDGIVNGVDLAAVLSQWGMPSTPDSGADINEDFIVDGQDLAFVLSGWGPCPSDP